MTVCLAVTLLQGRLKERVGDEVRVRYHEEVLPENPDKDASSELLAVPGWI